MDIKCDSEKNKALLRIELLRKPGEAPKQLQSTFLWSKGDLMIVPVFNKDGTDAYPYCPPVESCMEDED